MPLTDEEAGRMLPASVNTRENRELLIQSQEANRNGASWAALGLRHLAEKPELITSKVRDSLLQAGTYAGFVGDAIATLGKINPDLITPDILDHFLDAKEFAAFVGGGFAILARANLLTPDNCKAVSEAGYNALTKAEELAPRRRAAVRHMPAVERIATTERELLPGLNGAQKNIIEGILSFPFDSISELLSREEKLRALELMMKPRLSEDDKKFLKAVDMVAVIGQVRDILAHPYPQNRAQGYSSDIAVPAGHVSYRTPTGFASEPQGLLGLTARVDGTHSAPTKEQVCQYIAKLINEKMIEYSSSSSPRRH